MQYLIRQIKVKVLHGSSSFGDFDISDQISRVKNSNSEQKIEIFNKIQENLDEKNNQNMKNSLPFQDCDQILDLNSQPENQKKICEDQNVIIIAKIGESTSQKAFCEENRNFVSFYKKEYITKIKAKYIHAIQAFKEHEMTMINFTSKEQSR